MQITELPSPNLEAITAQYAERTDGLHLSTITHDLLCTIDPKRFEERKGGKRYDQFLAGIVWERALEMAWLDLTLERGGRPELIRPGEAFLDGIICTADAYDTLLGRPEEYKCTKMSCRQFITDRKFWHFQVQLKCEAKVWGCTSGALWVMYINGNYSWDNDDPNSGYVIRGYGFEWSQLEVDETWWMCRQHAQKRGWLK